MASDTPTTKTEYAHIVCTPGVLGGKPRVAGHRIRVSDIAAARDLRGFSPEEIAATLYPDLTLAQVYAALAYYEDHRDLERLREDIRPALERSLRGESEPLDIDDIKTRGRERLRQKGITD